MMLCLLNRNHLLPKKTQDLIRNPRLPLTQTQAQRGGRSVRQKTNPDALKKISELESELLKLRAQIARIVTAAPCSGTNVLNSSLTKQTCVERKGDLKV